MPLLASAIDFLKLGPITTSYNAPSATTGAPHPGIDLGIAAGTPVPVPVAGTVTRIFQDSAGGIQAIVTTREGFQQIFAHLGSVLKAVGSKVNVGDVLAFSGYSGTVVPSGAAGAHLHYEVRMPTGSPIDPQIFLSEFSSGATTPISSSPKPAAGGAQPTGWQCFLLAAEAFVVVGDKANALSAVTGIPKDQLQAAAYACAAGARDTKIPGEDQAAALGSIAAGLGPILAYVSSPKHWAQVGFTVLGGGLILFGLVTYSGSLRPGRI